MWSLSYELERIPTTCNCDDRNCFSTFNSFLDKNMVTQIEAFIDNSYPSSKYCLHNTYLGTRSFICCEYVKEALSELPNTITFSVSTEEQNGWETLFTDANKGVFDEKAVEIHVYGAMSDFLHENVGPCKQFWWKISK